MTITTGLKSLDRILGTPLRPGTITLYCGFAGSGMTTLLDTAAVATGLINKVPTVLADAETSRRAHADRIMSAQSGVPLAQIRRGDLAGIDRARVVAVKASTHDAPLSLSEARSIDALQEDITTSRARFVAVDGFRYLGYTADYDPGHAEKLLTELKQAAMDRNLAMVVTSPLSRMKGSERRPSLALVEDGLAQAADAIVLVDRPDSLGADGTAKSMVAELHVVKNRHGATGSCEAAGQFTHARFIDLPHSGDRAA